MKIKLQKKGFSLLEVLVFVTILGLFFITAISVSVYTLRDMRVSQNRVYANKYAQEMIEWLKSEKEYDWNVFLSQATLIESSPPGCWEFNKHNIQWTSADQNCTDVQRLNNELGIFRRKVTFDAVPATPQVRIHVEVVWRDGRQTYTVPIDTVFNPWQ